MTTSLDIDRIRWLFFDLGYTLIDEEAAAMGRLRQASEALAMRGITASPSALRRALEDASARFDPNPFANVLRAFTDNPEVIAFVRQSGRYPKELEAPYPRAIETLERLSARYKLGIISNQPPGTEERLRAYGMRRFFRVCVSSAEAGLSKPDERIFWLALEEAGCAPSDAAMIGDRLDNDIAPAKALGFATVRILQGPSRTQVARSAAETPDADAADIDALADIFGV